MNGQIVSQEVLSRVIIVQEQLFQPEDPTTFAAIHFRLLFHLLYRNKTLTKVFFKGKVEIVHNFLFLKLTLKRKFSCETIYQYDISD